MSSWNNWVSASAVRNWIEEEPLLDWLKLCGEDKGLRPDGKRAQYDRNTDMAVFLREKGRAFEAGVIGLLRDKCVLAELPRDEEREEQSYWEHAAAETQALIKSEAEAIYQGVVMDPERQMYGRPDLIVRSDALQRLFGSCVGDLGDARHYRVVDIKFTSIGFNAAGFVGNDDKYRKAQLLVYNRGLAAVQGYFPPLAYIGVYCVIRQVTSSCRTRHGYERTGPCAR